ncbi:MAG TPA: ABC transporter permease [Clostridiaceae bacterium]|nr:ABC transporter permease [Clostridiaceae bacterium]
MSILVEKRHVASVPRRLVTTILFVLLGLAFSSIFIIAKGFNPLTVFGKMVSYSFLGASGIESSIMAGTPLMFCGLSVALAFKMNLNNIGAEGQYAMGAILGGGFALFGPDMPVALKIALMLILCALGGAIWAMIAAILKALWDVNETIVTLLLNYIALLFLDYLCYGPWMAKSQTSPNTERIPKEMFLPNIGDSGVNSVFIFALLLALVMLLCFKYSTVGYQIEMIKNSKQTAEYAGINVKKYIVFVLATSGAIAGLAGFAQVAGIVHRLQTRLPGGSGYTGIVIAYLSQFNPIVIIVVSILFGGLINSSAVVQIMGVPSQIATMIQGSIMIFVIAGEFFNRYRVTFRPSAKKSAILLEGEKAHD